MKITAIEPLMCNGGLRGGLGGARHPTDLAGSAEQIRRYLGAPGVLGVKVHGERSGTPTASKAMADLFG